MKKIILCILLTVPALAQAGILSFLGDVSSISSAMNSGQQSYSQSDLKEINSYLWWYVERNKKLDGYEFLAEALEKSNDAGYLDTAAQAYYIHGQKEKALEIYETRVLPTARATCRGCEKFYKKMVGLSSNQKVPYSKIYKKQQKELEALQKQKELEAVKNAEVKSEEFPINLAIWGILATLLLNLTVNTIALFKSKQLTS
ncbi:MULTISPECIES: hypothetical protein [Thalassotalea]|uniref:Sel1 repeat family protein n=1 Tax=Thalassotalea castellviae TaxID=3075612 RepID=A0ABU3A3J7_9GAMM|nr:hypothetical protein [Thalassotalea sp. W431]MDT0603688.1 hypothetical protein [Thalassotalea sp. W431]